MVKRSVSTFLQVSTSVWGYLRISSFFFFFLLGIKLSLKGWGYDHLEQRAVFFFVWGFFVFVFVFFKTTTYSLRKIRRFLVDSSAKKQMTNKKASFGKCKQLWTNIFSKILIDTSKHHANLFEKTKKHKLYRQIFLNVYLLNNQEDTDMRKYTPVSVDWKT